MKRKRGIGGAFVSALLFGGVGAGLAWVAVRHPIGTVTGYAKRDLVLTDAKGACASLRRGDHAAIWPRAGARIELVRTLGCQASVDDFSAGPRPTIEPIDRSTRFRFAMAPGAGQPFEQVLMRREPVFDKANQNVVGSPIVDLSTIAPLGLVTGDDGKRWLEIQHDDQVGYIKYRIVTPIDDDVLSRAEPGKAGRMIAPPRWTL